MSKDNFQALLSPGRIGTMKLRNRILVTAMGASLAEPDGHCGPRIRAYHKEQAKGGVGLIITGVAGVAWPVGSNQINQIAISDDCFLPGLRALVDAVHAHGSKIAPQLHHGGLVAQGDMLAGRPIWCPSIPDAPKGDFTEAFLLEELAAAPFGKIRSLEFKVMTADDIRTVRDQFAAAAVRAKSAGFDAIEIHGGHGYLLSSFLSPAANKRTDEYGGALENRARFLLEVIEAVRAAVGPDFPVWCKLDSREVGKEGGITIDDAIRTAQWVEAAGVDAITVTAYHDPGNGKLHSASHTPHEPGLNIPFAARIKAGVSVPVIASGRITPERGNDAIVEGSLDFVSMGRPLLADPHLPRKLAEGRRDDVLPCIYCYTCISAIYHGQPVRCAVNTELGFEYRRDNSTHARKRVVIVGGGPAGMEAARRLDIAGHDVVLLERSDRLGGTLRFAALAYTPNEWLLDWLRREVGRSRVDVRLGTDCTIELVRSLKPDAVIVATGAIREMPDIPGGDLPHVLSADDMRQLMLGESSASLKRKTGLATRLATKIGAATGMTNNLDFVRAATRRWMPLGKRVVIIGGELVGLELAEFLNERGRTVSVVDSVPRFGKGLTIVRRMRLLDELRTHDVALYPGSAEIRIDPEAVHFVDKDGVARDLPADHVIVAKGARGDLATADELEKAGFAVHRIGDATGVGYIEGAMRGAASAVATIHGVEVDCENT
jgi:2,4-dienoyl-CoA reductase-like NADH-dependent reductase (Old Yellow Enzyme family)/NADPH-dependent 2,4-dienoyl-CoA reductase/sulfur reductase-like enzyme